METKKKKKKTATRGTKAEDSVRFGSENLTRAEINERYPICEYAQKVIDALKPGSDESSLFHLDNCFRGFCEEMQIAMATFLIMEYSRRITGEEAPSMTGVFHVDRLLMEIVYILDHDTKNIEDNF